MAEARQREPGGGAIITSVSAGSPIITADYWIIKGRIERDPRWFAHEEHERDIRSLESGQAVAWADLMPPCRCGPTARHSTVEDMCGVWPANGDQLQVQLAL